MTFRIEFDIIYTDEGKVEKIMEEVKRINKEFGEIREDVSKRWKKIDKNQQMLITFQEGKVCGVLSICYSFKTIPDAILDVLKGEFEFYKILVGVED